MVDPSRDAMNAMHVVNVDMAKAWEEEGARWAEQADRYDATVRRHTVRLFEAARIALGDRVLDIGCGCGETTRAAARAARSGFALGVDLSGPMLAMARERAVAESVANIEFLQADAQVHPFERESFDLVISRFGAMFFVDSPAAFRNIANALRPGGRLAIVAWQELSQNAWLLAVRAALASGRTLPEPPPNAPGPFGLADADRVRQLLAEAGYREIDLADVREPMEFGTDTDDAFRFARTMGPVIGLLNDLDQSASARALEALRDTLAAHEGPTGVFLDSRSWLITAQRD
jgi:ubiquinone/menaquinone biosynthesis C-methylase UbiE